MNKAHGGASLIIYPLLAFSPSTHILKPINKCKLQRSFQTCCKFQSFFWSNHSLNHTSIFTDKIFQRVFQSLKSLIWYGVSIILGTEYIVYKSLLNYFRNLSNTVLFMGDSKCLHVDTSVDNMAYKMRQPSFPGSTIAAWSQYQMINTHRTKRQKRLTQDAEIQKKKK